MFILQLDKNIGRMEWDRTFYGKREEYSMMTYMLYRFI